MTPSRPSTGRRIAAVTALLIPILAVGAFLLVRASDDSEAKSRAAVETFAAAWSRGDDAGAGALTDSPKAAAALKTNRAGLDGAKVTVTPGALTVKDDRATGRLRIEWQVPAIGTYAYTAPVTAIKSEDDRWLVALRPAHDPPAADRHHPPRDEQPKPRPGPASSTATARRSSQERAVVRVGLQRDKVTDVDESATALADRARRRRQGAAPPRSRTPGRSSSSRRRRCARPTTTRSRPTSTASTGCSRSTTRRRWRRPAPSPARCSAASGRPPPSRSSSQGVAPGQQIGQWGLQQVFEKQLAGVAERRILIRDSETRRARPHAQDAQGPQAEGAADHARPQTPGRPPSSALGGVDTGGRARRRAALDRRHPGRRQPADGLDVRPRAGRRLRPRLDVQGDHHRRAAARRLRPRRATSPARRRWSSTARRSRTSRARRRAPRASPTTSRSRATPPSSRSATGCPASALGKVAKDYGVGRTLHAAGRRRPLAGPGGHGQGQPRRGDDRAGPHHRHAAGHGRRRRHRRRRPLAPAAPGPRRPASRPARQLADERADHAARPDAPGRDPRHGRDRAGIPGEVVRQDRARPSSARRTRRTPTPGSSPTAATWRSRSWSSRASSGGSVAAPLAAKFFQDAQRD